MNTPLYRYARTDFGIELNQNSQDLRKIVGLQHCPPLSTGEDVARAFAEITQLKHEAMVAGAVDNQLRLIGWSVVSQEPRNWSALRVGDVFAPVIEFSASGVVLIRNSSAAHPRTSPREFEFIRDVSEAAQLLGYTLLDYLVISKQAWCSLLERPLIEAHAATLNLSRAKAKSGRSEWNCRRCSKTNRHDPKPRAPIYGMYTTMHCGHCRTFAWVM